METKNSTQAGARLPPSLYRWLRGKVCTPENPNGEYRNMSQALIGELSRAKICGDLGLLSPRARPTDNNPSPQNDHICPQGEKQCLQA